MEFPRTALNVQRGLALLLLAATLGVAVVERQSPFISHVRSNRPWPFWLSVHEAGGNAAPSLQLGVYRPAQRSLVLIRIPKATRLEGKLTVARAFKKARRATDDESAAARTVEELMQIRISSVSTESISWDTAGRLSLELEVDDDDDEPAVAAARALKARGRSPRALWTLLRAAAAGLSRGDRTAADVLFLTLELRRIPLENLQPALLPDDADAPDFLARTFAPEREPRNDEKATVIEVLNGTDSQGLAAQASKVLRSKGVDVMSIGQAPRPRSRTVVYDRTGDFVRAARVRAALGCTTAIAATRIDALRGVDASVELGADCDF